MRTHRYPFTGMLGIALIFSLVACNLPTAAPPDTAALEAQAGTLVAQTLTANAPAATATSTRTPKPTATKAPTATPTYAVPMLTIDANTNCRNGPGQEFALVTTFGAGESVEIVGKHPDRDYWVVKNTHGAGTCWIWSEYATVSGSVWAITTMTPPPTVTPSPPLAPSLAYYDFACTWNGVNNDLTVNFSWTDNANNEMGFAIFRDGKEIGNLLPDSTAYTDVVAVDTGIKVTYLIQAYNNNGLSSGGASFSAACE